MFYNFDQQQCQFWPFVVKCCYYERSISSKNLGNSPVFEIITQLVELRNLLLPKMSNISTVHKSNE